jgi:RND family efflux transporter MFP subunit
MRARENGRKRVSMTGYRQGREGAAERRPGDGTGVSHRLGYRRALMTVLAVVSCMFTMAALAGAARGEEFAVPGLIEAWNQVTMKTKVNGTVGAINVREGEDVKKGMVLVELENAREKAAIKLAEASLDKAKAALAEARVSLQNSRKDLERKEMMKDIIAKKDYENAKDAVLQNEANVSGREGEVKEAEAMLLLRTAELGNTMVRAPFDGTVTDVQVKLGETVAEVNTPICDVAFLDTLYIQVAVPVQYLPRLKRGSKVSVKIEKESPLFTKRFSGEIKYVNPIVDPTSRRVRIKVVLHNPSRLIRPGMVAEVIFPANR